MNLMHVIILKRLIWSMLVTRACRLIKYLKGNILLVTSYDVCILPVFGWCISWICQFVYYTRYTCDIFIIFASLENVFGIWESDKKIANYRQRVLEDLQILNKNKTHCNTLLQLSLTFISSALKFRIWSPLF